MPSRNGETATIHTDELKKTEEEDAAILIIEKVRMKKAIRKLINLIASEQV